MVKSKSTALQLDWQDTVNENRKLGHCNIAVVGVGGAGSNTITRLMEMSIKGAKCIAINTDIQHLNATRATHKILIGKGVARGFSTGGDSRVGRASIEESEEYVEELLRDVDVAFVAAGLGGGTGTGAAPIVAKIARRNGAIVVGVATMPFRIEKGRIECAAQGLTELRKECDTVVVVDNDKLAKSAGQLPLNEAFKIADQVLANMIRGIVETISAPSLINLDLADFRTIVRKGGLAVVGVGESDAPDRAEEAVRNALSGPLFNIDYEGATGALIHISGDDQMTVEEANRVGEIITEMMKNNATVVWGARVNPSLAGILEVTLVMTGVNSPGLPSAFRTIAPNLFNIDPGAEPEKDLPIDLGLDQLENFE
ncbi:MAG: cell division protein FtsZ [Candidatus Bathyarchaeota archaeon]|nr:MAG: cell division protein FtsZ [Candidatus Bathyarchaeota archaeon]